METTFQELLSADNTVRQRAEANISNEFTSNPSQLAQALIAGLQTSTEVATLCCVLLKKYFLDVRSKANLSAADLEGLKTAIEGSLDFDNQPMVLLKRKGDVLSKIYSKLEKKDVFVQYLVTLCSSESAKCRQFAMYVFEILSEMHLSSEELTQAKADFMTIFERALQDSEVVVRVAALKAISAFVSGIDDSDVALEFAPVLALLLNVIVEALQADEDQGRQALESLCELTSAHPECWKKETSKLLNVTAQIAQQKTFEDGTRAAAIEVVLSLSATMPAPIRKAAETKSILFPALTQMLMEVTEDDAEWQEEVEDHDKMGSDPISTASSSIARLAEDLGEKTTLACCQPIIAECVRSESSQQRQAGYLLLGLIAETCKESYAKNLAEAMQMASAGVQDQDQRVRYAALGTLAALMEQLSPYVQIKYHGELMPVLGQLMVGAPNLKLQTQATRSIHAFCTGLLSFDEEDEESTKVSGKEIMTTYASQTLTALVDILQKSIQERHEPLQVQVLSLIGTISDVIQEDFQQYFGTFVPIMVNLLTSVAADSMEAKKLRARAIQTLGSIIRSVADNEDKEPFKAPVIEITQHLATTIQGRLADDDPQDEAIKETLAQCAGFLGQEFTQFMPQLLDQLVADAQLSVDFKMESVDMPTTTDDHLSMKVKVKGLGEQRISMNTDALLRKTGAFDVLCKVSENLGKAFAPFVEPLLPIVSQHMSYDHSKAIRKYALKIFKSMLVAVGEPQNIQLLQQAFPMYIEQLQKALTRHDDKTTKILIKSLANNLRAMGRENEQHTQFLNQEQIDALQPILKETLDLVSSLKSAHRTLIQQTKSTYDIDEEDMDKIKEEMAQVGRVASQAMELSGQLVEKFKDQAFTCVDTSSKAYWTNQLQGFAELTEEELLDVLCFWCDFVDHTSIAKDSAVMADLATKFLQILEHEEFSESDLVKNTVAYGLGAFAHVLPKETFQPFLAKSVQLIKSITMRDGAFSPDEMEATENAMGALAKIAYKHIGDAGVTEADLCGVFSFFPLKEDECEAQVSHRIFLEQILDSSSVVHTAAVKPAAQEALTKIRERVQSETADEDVKVLSFPSKAVLALQISNF